ncbi:hypothetical protein Nepgr_005205 [Nepenthes gracilis]|uniref:C3H1-type domain-containing protein n=1 Tax=Nepenthes gracilis TaxID=150966 RepID=A0AAD3S376_NEPGR|nr:hypothetical protein Nepgr_005205 [Nepenthes gracilis]
MMIRQSDNHHQHPTVHVPPWLAHHGHPTVSVSSPQSVNIIPNFNNHLLNYDAVVAALQRYLPSNVDADAALGGGSEADLPALDAYSSDEFRLYEFKVRRCMRARAHDWTECPYAHPGEKARRRDPRRYSYSGTACTDFRKGSCRKGEACEFAHGVFECWLHPSRYRTQACKDGSNCKRRVCFFAHSPDELRVAPGLPGPVSINSFDDSPAVSPIVDSPPVTPVAGSLGSINEIVTSLRSLQLSKANSMPSSSWRTGSPRYVPENGHLLRPGFYSLPTTPTRPRIGHWDLWDKEREGEHVMERVESGRELRTRMFEKLSKENPLDCPDPDDSSGPTPDVGWISDLVI